jgi:hypothetical protein
MASMNTTQITDITVFDFLNLSPQFVFNSTQIAVVHEYESLNSDLIQTYNRMKDIQTQWEDLCHSRHEILNESSYQFCYQDPLVNDLFTQKILAEETYEKCFSEFEKFSSTGPYGQLKKELFKYFHVSDYEPTQHFSYLIDCYHLDNILTEIDDLTLECEQLNSELNDLAYRIADGELLHMEHQELYETKQQCEKQMYDLIANEDNLRHHIYERSRKLKKDIDPEYSSEFSYDIDHTVISS